MRWKSGFAVAFVFSAFSAFSAVNTVEAQNTKAADSTAAAKVVDDYHAALSSGDSARALSLLAPDAVILESGGMETRAEYRSHHLGSDMSFAKAVKSERSPVVVRIDGNTAWTSSTSVTQGTFNGRPINSLGAESMVLTRGPDGWRIRAIHWSSRNRRPPAT